MGVESWYFRNIIFLNLWGLEKLWYIHIHLAFCFLLSCGGTEIWRNTEQDYGKDFVATCDPDLCAQDQTNLSPNGFGDTQGLPTQQTNKFVGDRSEVPGQLGGAPGSIQNCFQQTVGKNREAISLTFVCPIWESSGMGAGGLVQGWKSEWSWWWDSLNRSEKQNPSV